MTTKGTKRRKARRSPSHVAPPPTEPRRVINRPAPSRFDGLTRGLGWFSIALGAAELVAPGAMGHLVGMKRVRNPMAIRLLGLREIAGGVGILTQSDPAPWLWARVAGDVMDLALLGRSRDEADHRRLIAASVAVAGVTALDIYGSRRAGREEDAPDVSAPRRIEVRKTVTIARPPSEVYEFWRNLENLPRFMEHLESVRVLDETRSSWKAKGLDGSYEWQAEIIADARGELIAWRSLPPSDALNEGVVRFLPAPGDQGTEVHVELQYEPPAGAIGAAIARLFGREPGQQVMADLRRLKQVLETGEVMVSGEGKGARR